MILGFTGTSRGMTHQQIITVVTLLKRFSLIFQLTPLTIFEIHHGDCAGSDYQVHKLAMDMSAHIVLHPPSAAYKRAFCNHADETRLERPYLERNKDIVNEGKDGLIACPSGFREVIRSGTWSTVRYARKLNRHIWIILPDGIIREEQ